MISAVKPFSRSHWIVPIVGAIAAVVFAYSSANLSVFNAINRWSTYTGPHVWPYITILGDTAVALCLFLPFAFRRRDILWALLLSGLIATLFVHAVKPFVDGPRPPSVLAADQLIVIGPAYKAQSFPSGHTTTIFVAAALIWLHVKARWARYGALAIAILVGLSRAVVGVHWPLDIAAGAAGGWTATLMGTALAQRLHFGLNKTTQVILTLILAGCAMALLFGLNTGYPQARQLQFAIGAVALGSIAITIARMLSHKSEQALNHDNSTAVPAEPPAPNRTDERARAAGNLAMHSRGTRQL